MKVISLKPEQLPILLRLQVGEEIREYVLIKTRQDKLLLNKSTGENPTQNR
jgi:hypothetical protein